MKCLVRAACMLALCFSVILPLLGSAHAATLGPYVASKALAPTTQEVDKPGIYLIKRGDFTSSRTFSAEFSVGYGAPCSTTFTRGVVSCTYSPFYVTGLSFSLYEKDKVFDDFIGSYKAPASFTLLPTHFYLGGRLIRSPEPLYHIGPHSFTASESSLDSAANSTGDRKTLEFYISDTLFSGEFGPSGQLLMSATIPLPAGVLLLLSGLALLLVPTTFRRLQSS